MYEQPMAASDDPSMQIDNGADDSLDIEKEIQQEIQGIRRPAAGELFKHIRVNMQCGEHVILEHIKVTVT